MPVARRGSSGGPRSIVVAPPRALPRGRRALPCRVGALPGPRQALHGGAARRALDRIDAAYRQIERHRADLTLARSARDLRRAKREGKIAALLGIEGGHAIENSLSALRSFYRLGVRTMMLTHVSTNDWAESAGGALEPAAVRHRGLSPFGEEVVREMQRIGMLVDVSHASEATFRSVLEVAKAPVITASSVRGHAHHRRPLDDDLLRALAKSSRPRPTRRRRRPRSPAMAARGSSPRPSCRRSRSRRAWTRGLRCRHRSRGPRRRRRGP